jgi:hypothetical protein
MKKVWIVTCGEYSEYGISAVFSTEENARLFIEAVAPSHYDQGYRVEEYELDGAPETRRGLKPFAVYMNQEGYVIKCVHSSAPDAPDSPEFKKHGFVAGRFDLSVWARDEKHAIEVANDKRRQYIAEHGWPPKAEGAVAGSEGSGDGEA